MYHAIIVFSQRIMVTTKNYAARDLYDVIKTACVLGKTYPLAKIILDEAKRNGCRFIPMYI